MKCIILGIAPSQWKRETKSRNNSLHFFILPVLLSIFCYLRRLLTLNAETRIVLCTYCVQRVANKTMMRQQDDVVVVRCIVSFHT